MQLKIYHTNAGVSIASLSAAYIEVRNSETGQHDIWGLGRKATPRGLTKLGLSHVVTKRFPVNPSENTWLAQPEQMLDKKARLEISGHSYFGWGQVKVKLIIYDEYGSPEHQLVKAFAPTRSQSFITGQSKAAGQLKLLSPADCSTLPYRTQR